ncbi:MAG: ankyrin-2-like [Phycisphaerales bacterium]|nr:ankyrin-2-like [Phycisphaerales bacterium]
MRVLKAILIATATATLAAGCNRAKAGANKADSTAPTKQTASSLPAEDQRPVAQPTPAKQLFQAIRISPDERKVRQLLSEHPELTNKEVNGASPLWMACESRSLPLVKAVVECGADLKATNSQHQSVLWAAVNYGSVPIIKYLIEKGVDPKALQDDGETLLWAAETKQMAELMIDAGVDPKQKNVNGDTALHMACRHSLLEVVELLLDKGVDIEAKGHWDMRPLHSAASTITGDARPVVMLLLRRGAEIDSRGFHGHTAIHECALYNRFEMTDLLLSRGAEPDLKDDEGRTPVDTALLAGKIERVDLINLLVKRGAAGELIPVSKD